MSLNTSVFYKTNEPRMEWRLSELVRDATDVECARHRLMDTFIKHDDDDDGSTTPPPLNVPTLHI